MKWDIAETSSIAKNNNEKLKEKYSFLNKKVESSKVYSKMIALHLISTVRCMWSPAS